MAEKAKHDGERRRNPWRIARWTAAAALLLLPLIAMQFTDEVLWTPFDFAVFAALLGGALGAYELLATRTRNIAYRAGVGVGAAATFLLLWLTGAVGIIGNEHNDANVMYLGVLSIGGIGSVVGRFRAIGMARALGATAFAQALVAVIAILGDLAITDPMWPRKVVTLTVFFCALWLLSAGLFRAAADDAAPADGAQ